MAYKKGLFPLEEGLSPTEFNEQAAEFLLANYDSAWLLGEKPFGIVYGQAVGPMMMLGDATWFPWASSRNIIEGVTQLVNELRKTAKILLYCSIEDKRFYEHIAKHGILRRVGHIHDIDDGPSVLWESKPWAV